MRKTLAERFTTRGSSLQWMRRGVGIERADKRNLQATVYDKDWFMATQEQGGEKAPQSGAMATIPGAELKPLQFRPKVAELLSRPATFRQTLADGSQAILQRTGAERYPLTVLDILRRSVDVRPRFGMEQTVEKSVGTNFAPQFVRAATVAMRTAR